MRNSTIHISRTLVAVIALLLMTGFATTAWGQLLFNENFSYTSATLLTANGWSAHSGTGTNSEYVSSAGLSYVGYASSGIGKAASIVATGEDDNKAFATYPSGITGGGTTRYYSLLVRIDTARGANGSLGDYFFHLYKSSTTFTARLFQRKKYTDATKFSFGIAKSSTAANVAYTDSIYAVGTTYLVVVKYIIVAGATNDSVQLFINPTIGAAEPTPTLKNSTADIGTADVDTVYNVAIRQGNAAQGPSGVLDGIRVGTTWSDVTGSVAAPTVTTGASSSVTTSGASLAGTVVSNNGSTTASFDYGTTVGYGSSATATQSPVDNGYGTTTITATLSGLDGNTTYHYRATGTNSAGTTNGSDMTFKTIPNAPTTTAATSVTTTSFTANWTAGAGGTPVSYELDVSTDIGFGSFVSGYNALSVAGTSQSVTGLSAGTTYYYRARAVGSLSANSNTTTVSTVPDAPVATAATSVATTSFDANWGSVTGATSYRLDVATDAGFASILGGYNDLTVAGTSQSVTGLTPNTAYHYRVRAVNTGGTSTNSNTIDVMTTCPTITLASIANGTVGTAYDQTAGASGGTAPYGYAVTLGSLPGWASLNASTGEITGTPNAAGSASFTITATDSNGCTGSKAYTPSFSCPTLTFAPASGALSGATAGVAYTDSVKVSGGNTPTYSISNVGGLPPGLSQNTSTGLITGTPTTAGSYSFKVIVTDTYGCSDSSSYSIDVTCPAITLSPTSLPNGQISVSYSQTITASGGTGSYTFTVDSGSIPLGLTLHPSGLIDGMPTASECDTFKVKATDTFDGCVGYRVYIICTSACPVLTFAPPTLTNGTKDASYSATISVTGGTGPFGYFVTGGSLPSGLSLLSDGSFSGAPTVAGVFSFTVTAHDSANGCEQAKAYTLVICGPITQTGLVDGTVGTAYSHSISSTGGTPGYSYVKTLGTLPAGLTLDADGLLHGTPSADAVFTFTVQVTDTNGCTDTKVWMLTMSCPSVSVANYPDGTTGVAYDNTPSVTGGTGPYTFAKTGGTLPPPLMLESNGQLHGTPNAAGTYDFDFTVMDSYGCTSLHHDTVNIVCPAITVDNPAPDGYNAVPGYSHTYTASGGTGPYTFAITTPALPTGLSMTLAGVISGTPSPAGTYTYTVTATDANGCTGTLDESATIFSCPPITLGSLPDGTQGISYSGSAAASGGVAPYTYAVTVGSLPPGLMLNVNTGAVTSTPTVPGTYAFTITATDANGCTGSQAYSVNIACPTITLSPTILPNGKPTVSYPAQTISASGGTGPYSFTVTLGTLPDGLTLHSLTGVIDGTPTTAGSFTFTIEATDANGCKGTRTYTIVIEFPAVFKVHAAGPSNTSAQSTTAVDTLFWDDPATWVIVSGGSITGTPQGKDQVILDHTYRSGPYVVSTGANSGQSPTKFDSAAQITVGTIGDSDPSQVELLIPPNAPTSPSGSTINSLKFGDGVAGNYDMIIQGNGRVSDDKNVFARSCAFRSLNDTMWIRTGGWWYHNTKGFNTMHRVLSRRFDGDYGTIEFDINGAVSGTFDISGGGNYWYPNVVISNTHGFSTYYWFGTGATTIKGNLTVNAGAKDSLMLTGYPFMHFGNIVNNGTIVAPTSSLVFAGSTPQTVSGNPMSLNAGVVNLNPAGVNLLADMNVTGGSVQTTGNFNYDSTGGGLFVNRTAVGTINTGTSTIYLNPSGSMNEGTNVVQGNVSATRTVGTSLETFGSIGYEIGPSSVGAGSTTVNRKTGVASTGNGHSSILRYYDVTPTTDGSANAQIGLSYTTGELNGNTEASLILHKSSDNGATWSGKTSSVNVSLHKITAIGVNALHYRWTAASSTAPLFITHTVTMRKLTDTDGDPNTKGDQSLKKWRLTLQDATGATVNTGNPNSGVLTTANLESGTYYAVEEDSIGWLHLGVAEHGTTLSSVTKVRAARFDTVAFTDFQPNSIDTVDFINQKVGTIVVRKFKDTDGNPSTIELAKQWHLAVYKGSIAPANLVTEADANEITASNLQAGTYIVCEADSGAGWVRLNGNQTRYDTITIVAGQAVIDTLINFRPNSILVRKYNDADGNFNTAGDRTLKVWYLSATPGGSSNSGTLSLPSLGDGSYTISEADSTGWIHLGYVLNGTPTAGSANNVIVNLVDGQSATVDFVNSPPIYSQLFRTGTMTQWALDPDKTGKQKALKAKPDSVHFKFNLVVRTDTLVVNFAVSLTHGTLYTSKSKAVPFQTWTDTRRVAVAITAPINIGDTVQFEGIGLKGKFEKVNYSWTSIVNGKVKLIAKGGLAPGEVPATPGDTMKLNQLLLPMPNLHNIGKELFTFKNAFQAEGGLLIGQVIPESIKTLAWVLHKKYSDVQASLNKKGAVHTGTPKAFGTFTNGHPMKGQLKSLPPDKQNNALFGEAVALGMNLAASDFGQMPSGFGDLIIGYPSPSECDDSTIQGMTVREFYNNLRKWLTDKGRHWNGRDMSAFVLCGNNPDLFAVDLLFVASNLNSAFSGPNDTTSWSGVKVVMTGVRPLIEVPFLHGNPGGPVAVPLVAELIPGSGIPGQYELRQNYPNPFNPTTTIEFALPEVSLVTLKVYNILGQEVASLLDHEMMDDGEQEVAFDASRLSSGVYFYRLTTESVVTDPEDGEVSGHAFTSTKKMLLVK